MNIIVSSTLGGQEGATVCATVNDAIAKAAYANRSETFCIGGAKLYEAMLPLVEALHISWINGHYEGDAHFPKVDFSKWEMKERREHKEFTYEKYLRRD